jgi:predicted regulator of Ras-like GTPase activity (Roadblock/LC7/MglB family)
MNQGNRSRALEESLRRLGMVVEGVKTCVVVNDDGFPLAAYPAAAANESADNSLSAAQVAAVSARLTGQAESMLDRLAQGDMGRLLLEGDSGTLLNCPAGDVTLALVVEPGASMGHVLFAAQKAASEIEAILARS